LDARDRDLISKLAADWEKFSSPGIIGAACDSYPMDRVLKGANLIYHKRFLHEKQARIDVLRGIGPDDSAGVIYGR